MRPALVVAVALLAAAPFALAASPVTFSLTLGNHLLPSHIACALDVAPGSNGGDVLDAAVATGCISSWAFDRWAGERFVTCIDGLCAQPGTFWAFYVDEALPDNGDTGIDRYAVKGGEGVEFAYTDWFTPFPPFSLL